MAEEEWKKFKPTTPYGSIPVLEVDGKMLTGSNMIARYLAEEIGLAGSNAFENAEIDSVSSIMDDLMVNVFKFHFEKDEACKAKLKKEQVETHFPRSGWAY